MLTNLILGVAAWMLLAAATRLVLTRPPQPVLGSFRVTGWQPGTWWLPAVVAGIATAGAATIILTGTNHALEAARNNGPGGTAVLAWAFAGIVLLGSWSFTGRYVPGTVRNRVVFAGLLCTVGMWLAYPCWLTTDLVTVIFIVQIIGVCQLRAPFAAISVALLVVAGGYDAVQVFLTHGMTQQAAVAVGKLPLFITVPAHLAVTSPPATALGCGDIWFPAVLVVTAGRIGQRIGDPAYYRAAITGYGAGIAAALTVVAIWSTTTLPATIFLVPGVVVAVTVTAACRHGLSELAAPGVPHPAAGSPSEPGSSTCSQGSANT